MPLIHVNFRQKSFYGSVSKTIQLAVVPQIGAQFEYEDDWALATVDKLSISKLWVSIDQYGPQFSEEELQKLEKLGWIVNR